jgi:NTP pyrophosphatase (non-canonical NTP hydrolase)
MLKTDLNEILLAVKDELDRAETVHPEWPFDILHGLSILVEEVGEAVQAGNDYVFDNGSLHHVRSELIQVAAMALRNLKNLSRNHAESRRS